MSKKRTPHRAPVVQGPLGSDWTAVAVWTGACYWHGVGGYIFNSPSAPAPATGSPPCSSHASAAYTAARLSSQGPASVLRFNCHRSQHKQTPRRCLSQVRSPREPEFAERAWTVHRTARTRCETRAFRGPTNPAQSGDRHSHHRAPGAIAWGPLLQGARRRPPP